MSEGYIRLCPVCAAANPAEAGHCADCGALLIGVDLTRPAETAPVAPAPPDTTPAPPATITCPHADCGAANPPGGADCLYCGRPMHAGQAPPPAMPAASLYNLPAALAANFAIEQVLPAAGAEAELMLLRGLKTGARVMAKLYRPGVAPKGEVLERVADVAHAHVVRLLAHGVSEGLAWEVMEYCPGGSLRGLMAGRPVARERAREILAEAAEAVAALHEARIIHRDLKPENILVRRQEPLDLVLTDFGIASLQDATQLFTGAARTARYAAPEALSGVLDAAADYWSLGMIVVELLSGRHPFADLSEPVIAHRLATGHVDVEAVADPAWRRLCRGLLQREPHRRWGIAEIRRWLAGDATLAEPAATAGALPHPYRIEGEECRSRPELAAAFSRRWPAARKDLERGQFESWVRQELKDHDLLRFVHDLKERGGSADLRLFRLIRHLAPAIPPAWRGDVMAADGVLAMAARATGARSRGPACGDATAEADAATATSESGGGIPLAAAMPPLCGPPSAASGRAGQGDTEAADWLESVFDDGPLELLPAAEFPAEAELARDWRAVWQAFAAAWREVDRSLGEWRQRQVRQGDAVMDIDTLMFGNGGGLFRPPAGEVHGALLLCLRRADYAAGLRACVLAEAAGQVEHSPWLADIARRAATADDIVAPVVLRHLLPQARQASEDGMRRIARHREDRFDGLDARVAEALAGLRDATQALGLLSGTEERHRLAGRLESFLGLTLEARGLAGTGERLEHPALSALARAEPLALRLRDELDGLDSAGRINQLWRNRHVLNTAAGALAVAFFVAPAWLPWLLAVPLTFAAWRFWIVGGHLATIRRLAAALPRHIGGAATR